MTAGAVTLWTGASLATARDGYGLIRAGAIATTEGQIAVVGPSDEVKSALGDHLEDAVEVIELGGRLVTPGSIDCHTHLVWSGSRAKEFEQRLAGATYAEIAAAGGGIRSTVAATRAASEDELVESALPRLDALLADGVTTIEVKSGYGLDAETELRLLRAARRLGEERLVEVVTTLLAAHTVPPEHAGRADAYVELVCDEIIPAAARQGLADAVDVFCETIAFDLDQTRRVLDAARRHDLPVKGHTEQLSWLGGSALLARSGALSIDHGEHLRPDDIATLADAGTTVVLLPGAAYFTGESQRPPVAELRAAGVPMAVATDLNPGTSPLASLRLAANQACVTFGLTVAEAFAGITTTAARALGLDDRGELAAGRRADLAIWDVEHPAELIYEPLTPRLYGRVVGGVSDEEGATLMATRRSDRVVRAPRGSELTCRSWLTEAPFRMIQNNLDPDVAEHPDELVVYGGIGRAARDWESFDAILTTLQRLGDDETLLVQSGKPVGVFETHTDAPRVLIANSNLVPHWATWEHFHELDRAGLMMYGQMTAGSWIYIGTQGIVQGTYETFRAMAAKHFDGDPAGRWILTGGLGGMGGAQPLAAVMAGFSCLVVECDESRIDFRLRTRYLDQRASTLDEALELIDAAGRSGEPTSVGLLGNTADVFPELVERGIVPDGVTDQTSAHDPLNGYLPSGWELPRWREEREHDPNAVVQAAKASMATQVRAMLELQQRGAAVVDYGNNLRQMAHDAGVNDAFDYPGFVPAYVRDLFCTGTGPFRWVALSGEPADILATDAKVKELIPDDPQLHRWLDMAQQRIAFQGLPARICWVGLHDRARLGLAFNEMVRRGEVAAPIVIGRDHLDSGSVASPNRETESIRDGSDAVSDWPLLNALLNTSSGATWVSIHHGGGVGMGYSQHAGMVVVCDGTEDADRRLARVLRNDPGSGVMRHADAGYELAVQCAADEGLDLPMVEHSGTVER